MAHVAGSVLDILSQRKRAVGSAYALSAKKLGYDSPVAQLPTFDIGAMSASAVISTQAPDRSADVMLTAGCRTENHKTNPVVLWDHGLAFTLPMGKSETPDGEYALTVGDNLIESTCYFTQKVKEACQIFELVTEKTIRATSVGFHFVDGKSEVRARPDYTDRPGILFKAWELVEWSWTAVGDNPDALAKAFGMNRLDGTSLSPLLRQSLEPLLPQLKRYVNGWRCAPLQATK